MSSVLTIPGNIVNRTTTLTVGDLSTLRTIHSFDYVSLGCDFRVNTFVNLAQVTAKDANCVNPSTWTLYTNGANPVSHTVSMTTPVWIPGSSGLLLELRPGDIYTLAISTTEGEFRHHEVVNTYTWDGHIQVRTPPPFLVPLGGRFQNQGTPIVGIPNLYAGIEQWYGGFEFVVGYGEQETDQTIPEAPEVVQAIGSDTINLPAPWQLSTLAYWEVQVSVSTDNKITWTDWLPIAAPQFGTYSYSYTNLYSKYYYRYRYRVKTKTQESNWSLISLPFRPKTA